MAGAGTLGAVSAGGRLGISGRGWIAIGVMAAALVGAAAVRVLASPDGLSAPLDGVEWRLRLMRVASGAGVGAALAVSGVLLQSLLRNPLAEPAVLGLTTGAGLGVTVSIYVAFAATGSIASHAPPAWSALAGALGALGLVGLLGQRRGALEPVSVLLVGVVVSLTAGAGIVFVQHLLPDQGVAMATRWVMGSLTDEAGWGRIAAVGGLAIAGAAGGAWMGPAMDAAALGEDEARSVGVRLGRLRAALFVGSGALTAGAVLLAGPIGFVGLIAPHAVRWAAGASHRALVIGSALLGAALIIAADALVRLVDFGAGRMPIGVLTAAVGGPVFLVLLRRAQRRGGWGGWGAWS